MYVRSNLKVTIICKIHGEFEQTPTQHLRPTKCKQCYLTERGLKSRSSTEEFIKKARKLHNDRYDYSLVNYVTSQQKVTIICPDHGPFQQTPNIHLRPSNCNKCAIVNTHNALRNTTEEFIEKAKKIHGDRYDYSKVMYINYKTEVMIICKIHGPFQQTPDNHLVGQNCP